MKQMTQQQFLNFAKKGNVIPVYKEILGDFETPVSAYHKLASKAKYSFLLESVEGQEKMARFSFISLNPKKVLRTKGNNAYFEHITSTGKVKKEALSFKKTPLEILQKELNAVKAVSVPELPVFFGGYVGFLSYDAVRFFEKLPNNTKDDLKVDDLVFVKADDVIIFDRLHHTIKIVSCVHTTSKDTKATLLRKYKQACSTINGLIRILNKPAKLPGSKKTSAKLKVKSNLTQAKFESMVKRVKQDIRKGEIIQAVLSQRLEVDIAAKPFDIYRSLRALNPSPYMFLLNLGDMHLVGASPEMLVRCEHGVAQTRPIAGTRPRGKTDDQDVAYEVDLLADPKEKAEHIMLVDLGRNDLGRVCAQGSITLKEFMIIERYSHVMHIVSTVEGKLKNKNKGLQALQSTFPAGTLSGAPKIRAMEIIEELEAVKRGPYGGCVGYLGYSKDIDTCITIRTILVKGKKAYVQAGAGIVADSKPKKEYEETLNKAKAQIKAIELAHNQ